MARIVGSSCQEKSSCTLNRLWIPVVAAWEGGWRAGDGQVGGGGGHTITAKLSCCSCCYLQSREEEVVYDPPPALCYLSKLCPSWTIHPPVHCAAV